MKRFVAGLAIGIAIPIGTSWGVYHYLLHLHKKGFDNSVSFDGV